MCEIRHDEGRGHEQKRSDEDAEEDGQFGEGTEVADDRGRDHVPADLELGPSGHAGRSGSDDKAPLPLTPAAVLRFVLASPCGDARSPRHSPGSSSGSGAARWPCSSLLGLWGRSERVMKTPVTFE